MAQFIFSNGIWSVLTLKTGESFDVKYMIPDGVEGLVDVIYKDISKSNHDGFNKITAKQDILLLVENLEGLSAKHCRFIRADRNWDGLELRQVCRFPRAQNRLRKAGVPSLHFLGGFTMVPAFDDEVVIADYGVSGAYGWVVEKTVLTSLLA